MVRRCLAFLFAMLSAGCGQNGLTVSPQNPSWQQADLAARQSDELQRRASSLDHDNQELEALLAQSRQQLQLLKDELGAVREQLLSANQQVAKLSSEKTGLESKSEALAASNPRRTTPTIRPSNPLSMDLNLSHLQGVEVRQDGDVIRVELAADKLFDPGNAVLSPDGKRLVETVAGEMLRSYRNQIIGVEGHSEAEPIQSSFFPSGQHLSLARATAVYDHLTGALAVPSGQLIVIGHGANHPVVSNATPSGKARNRRVELVIYPETFGTR